MNIDGSGKGSLTVGTIGVYSPSCTESADGVANLRDIVLYCSAAGIDNNNRYYGFNRATIASVTLVINTNGSKMKICPRWARLSDEFAISDYTSSYNKESSASTENQTIEFGGDTSFIAYPQDTYPCIHLYTSHSNAFNLISLTVQYTCK